MSKKQSLGHNPLAYSLRNHASFDFIPDNQSDKKEELQEKKVSKKVTSYYLEETVVEGIREMADSEETSYSCVANRMLKDSLEKQK